jgi:AcrR family transcriptional regulator
MSSGTGRTTPATGRATPATGRAAPAASRAGSTKQRILAISRDLFARQGFTGTTIADIASELGTTTAALYYHFPSKADILRGLLAEPMAAYARILDSVQTQQPSAAELLDAFIDLAGNSRELAVIIDRDPTVLAMIDEFLPMSSEQMTEQVIGALAGPDADPGAIIRAHAAFAVIKGATMAAMSFGAVDADGKFDPAYRAEVLDAALRALNR